MRDNKLALYVHFVWATWDRWPLLTAEIEAAVHHTLHGLAQRTGCKVLAIGGTENHVHLLVEMPPTLGVSAFMREIKGASAHWVNETLQPEACFKWQGSYAAFTVSRWTSQKSAPTSKIRKYTMRPEQPFQCSNYRLRRLLKRTPEVVRLHGAQAPCAGD